MKIVIIGGTGLIGSKWQSDSVPTIKMRDR
jgi:hypothetical protein